MREILFRGKDDESGKFVYGYNGLERDMRGSIPFVLKPSISWEENKILFSSFIVPETIGQYTGLTDKNGKKIFEGDIVLCKIIGLREAVVHKGVVEYLRDSFTVNIEGIVPPQDIIWFSIQNGDIEVIGEFVCDRIDTYDDDTIHAFSREEYSKWNDFELSRACIHPEDFEEYANDSWLYGWHISELVIYDEPKSLREFIAPEYVYGKIRLPAHEITRPPQSWCYIKEREQRCRGEVREK